MSVHPIRSHAGDESAIAALIEKLIDDVGMKTFLEIVGRRLGTSDPRSHELTIELRYEHGEFKWSKIHSGRLGVDDLNRIGDPER